MNLFVSGLFQGEVKVYTCAAEVQVTCVLDLKVEPKFIEIIYML